MLRVIFHLTRAELIVWRGRLVSISGKNSLLNHDQNPILHTGLHIATLHIKEHGDVLILNCGLICGDSIRGESDFLNLEWSHLSLVLYMLPL